MSRGLTGKNRPHISLFKGGIRGDRYKEPFDRLQAPCRANTQAVFTGVGNSGRELYEKRESEGKI